jgi:chorismate dehydratase
MLKVGVVNYVNTLPLFGGLLQKAIDFDGELITSIPTALNQKVRKQELDVSLVSSVEYLRHEQEYVLLEDFGIISNGRLGSVNFYTKEKLHNLSKTEVGLTTQSATSLVLLKLICRHFWKTLPRFTYSPLPQKKDYPSFLLIGDQALKNQKFTDYTTVDLSETWKMFTGLPFVFAVLVANKNSYEKKQKEIEDFLIKLRQSHKWSQQNLYKLSLQAAMQLKLPVSHLQDYFNALSYNLDHDSSSSLQMFKQLAKI